jgi:hypothetical protein
MQLLLGVDGGGSHTRVAIADSSGVVLGKGQAGSSNHQSVGFATSCADWRIVCAKLAQLVAWQCAALRQCGCERRLIQGGTGNGQPALWRIRSCGLRTAPSSSKIVSTAPNSRLLLSLDKYAASEQADALLGTHGALSLGWLSEHAACHLVA